MEKAFRIPANRGLKFYIPGYKFRSTAFHRRGVRPVNRGSALERTCRDAAEGMPRNISRMKI